MIRFEILSKENVKDVWELEKLCFDDPWTLNAFEAELGNKISEYIVAIDEETGSVAGYAGVWFMYDCADITNIAVSPEMRRGGLGEKLLTLLADISREKGMRSITLEVRVSNTPAIALYKKCGFEECGLRKRYYQGNEDALLMSKMLGGKTNENSCN